MCRVYTVLIMRLCDVPAATFSWLEVPNFGAINRPIIKHCYSSYKGGPRFVSVVSN